MNVFKIITLCLISLSTYASSCPKDNEKLALELLNMDLNGARVFEEEAINCQVPKIKTQFVKDIKEVPNEMGAKTYSFKSKDSFVIKDTIKHDENTYLVKYSINNSNKEIIQSSFMMIVHTSKKKIQKYGCAEFMSFPELIVKHKSCI